MYMSDNDDENYIINLIEKPSHVEAQTLSNEYLTLENDLEIITVLNNIDLLVANPDNIAIEIEETIGLEKLKFIQVSIKCI